MMMQRFLAVALLLAAPAGMTLLSGEKKQAAPAKPSAQDTLPKPAAIEPPSPGEIDAALQRGVALLLKLQNKTGSWGSPELQGGVIIYAPVPGAHDAFQAAVTAMCISALIEVGGDGDDVRRAIERGETWLLDNLPKVRRAEPVAIYNVWTHIYGIQALVRMHQRLPDPERRQRIVEVINNQVGFLKRYESVDKGWGYYDMRVGSQRPATDSTSFMTAAALVALREAKDIGIDVPERMVKDAVDSIHRQRLPDFSYLYGEYLKWSPSHPINRPGGSLGRSQACNLALRLWKDDKVTDDVIKTWLDRLIVRNGWLDMARKRPYPHESWFAVAGYFFYFGHYYAGLVIHQLPAAERPFYQDHLAALILRLQEKDGSWWDFPLYNYHQQYGTAFALMTLKCCKRDAAGR